MSQKPTRGRRLRLELADRGLSTVELSRRLDVTSATVTCWLTNRFEPRDWAKAAIARVFNLPTEEVFSWWEDVAVNDEVKHNTEVNGHE